MLLVLPQFRITQEQNAHVQMLPLCLSFSSNDEDEVVCFFFFFDQHSLNLASVAVHSTVFLMPVPTLLQLVVSQSMKPVQAKMDRILRD